MIDARKMIDFGRALRTEDKERAETITAHFESQSDLFTQCQKCRASLSGTLAQIQSHQCFSDLLIGA